MLRTTTGQTVDVEATLKELEARLRRLGAEIVPYEDRHWGSRDQAIQTASQRLKGAARLLGKSLEDEATFNRSPDDRVVQIMERMLQLAGINATVTARTSKSMFGAVSTPRDTYGAVEIAVAHEGTSHLLRPGTSRGMVDLEELASFINTLAGSVVVGAVREFRDWSVYRSTPQLASLMAAIEGDAASEWAPFASELLDAYLPHGLFQDYQHLSRADAAMELGRFLANHPRVSDRDMFIGSSAEMVALTADERRVWVVWDAEHYSSTESALVDTLMSWSAISEGMIVASNASVHAPPGGQPTLEAEVNARIIQVEFWHTDWMPTAAVQEAVNEIIGPTHAVLAGTPGSQDTIALVASSELRELIKGRGLAMTETFDW